MGGNKGTKPEAEEQECANYENECNKKGKPLKITALGTIEDDKRLFCKDCKNKFARDYYNKVDAEQKEAAKQEQRVANQTRDNNLKELANWAKNDWDGKCPTFNDDKPSDP